MLIGGYQKLTLIDYPGKIAATVFTVGCSFRCPFCHNPELVINHGTCLPAGEAGSMEHETRAEKEFLEFLKKRKGTLEGVCITGGEPTIQPDLINFIKKIKKMGYAVKLDTNGSRPDVLKKIIDGKLVDYIAMDIKNSLKNYSRTAKTKIDQDRIKLSVDLIRYSRLPYEFRTTVVPGIHREEDFLEIARWLKGARIYFLQKYEETKILDPKLKNKTRGKKINLARIKEKIAPYFDKIEIRG
jgi:pyruvate formate lyase activating enzyme